jgi:chaperonin GroES
MNVKPLQDRILLKRVESEDKTKSGLYIPDSAKEKPSEGIVLAVGAGKTLDSGEIATPQVKEGDRVLFGKYSGTEIKIAGDDHIIIREDDILGIVTEV